jgi:hypothetical protein
MRLFIIPEIEALTTREFIKNRSPILNAGVSIYLSNCSVVSELMYALARNMAWWVYRLSLANSPKDASYRVATQ